MKTVKIFCMINFLCFGLIGADHKITCPNALTCKSGEIVMNEMRDLQRNTDGTLEGDWKYLQQRLKDFDLEEPDDNDERMRNANAFGKIVEAIRNKQQ